MNSQNSGVLTSCGVNNSLLVNSMNEMVEKNNKNNDIEEEYFLVTEESGELQIIDRDDYQNDKLAQMCRTCGTVNDHLIPIFKEDGLEHNFSSKIQKHLPIKVCETDILPLQLCYQCAATLLAWDELSDGVLSAQSRLLRLQEQAEQRRSSVYEEPAKPEENTEFHQKESTEEEQSTQQAENNETLKTERSNRRDALLTIETNSKRSPRLEYFMKKCASALRLSDNNIKLIISNEENCTTQKDNIQDSKNNQNTSETSQTVHKVHVENSNKLRKNLNGEEIFQSKGDVEISEQRETDSDKEEEEEEKSPIENSLQCDKCDKKFHLEENLKTHAQTHLDEKIYTCHICGKQFGLTGSLYYHLRHVHDGVKNHSCDICGRCFAMKTTLEDHRRIHTGERPYVCDSCGKTFKTKASLYIHRKTHTNDYPHQCCYCKRGFRWKQQMLDHLTTHTGVKNHVCDICGKAFGVKNDLTRHKKIHSKEKPYSCLQCGLKFGQKRYLKNHERTKHR